MPLAPIALLASFLVPSARVSSLLEIVHLNSIVVNSRALVAMYRHLSICTLEMPKARGREAGGLLQSSHA